MSILVDDLLLLARLDQGRPLERKPVDLEKIARDACDDARAVAPRREISLLGDGQLTVVGDDLRLRQVVGNLVRNAIIHTPPATPIEVELSTADGHALLSVVDHGPGLPAGEEKRIFEPFHRADPGSEPGPRRLRPRALDRGGRRLRPRRHRGSPPDRGRRRNLPPRAAAGIQAELNLAAAPVSSLRSDAARENWHNRADRLPRRS